jgi:4a-hydroxytetrahydrobiopterin dehydratase
MTTSTDLLTKKCVPCEGGTEPLKGEKLSFYTPVTPDWSVVDEVKIQKEFKFKNFLEALSFVDKVGKLAESEGHHPDINLHNWNKVTLTLSTHAIKGLSENDFIMAVKIDQLPTSTS